MSYLTQNQVLNVLKIFPFSSGKIFNVLGTRITIFPQNKIVGRHNAKDQKCLNKTLGNHTLKGLKVISSLTR